MAHATSGQMFQHAPISILCILQTLRLRRAIARSTRGRYLRDESYFHAISRSGRCTRDAADARIISMIFMAAACVPRSKYCEYGHGQECSVAGREKPLLEKSAPRRR